MARIEDVLDTDSEQKASPSAHAAELSGAIELRNVSFRYPSEPRPVLDNVRLEVWPGECVAIVGASGSGKSTLARLIAGLYQPSAGTLLFDGIELSRWNLTQLREKLGIVTQETRLFSGSIRDNVALFEPTVPLDAVQEAAQLACLHPDVAAMPMGYDTMLADGGTSLSGGQRQRLSLARALLRRPNVLVLDEATSALDTVTEQRVQEQLRSLRCTRVIIAHRLSTIVEADKIVVLDQGRVVAVGKHEELVLICPTYQALIRAQQGATHSARPAQPQPASARPPAPPLGERVSSALPTMARGGTLLGPHATAKPTEVIAPERSSVVQTQPIVLSQRQR
jgi:ABC-type bacteriocin/lantibiotic exporter with double-glycine peptidase domain